MGRLSDIGVFECSGSRRGYNSMGPFAPASIARGEKPQVSAVPYPIPRSHPTHVAKPAGLAAVQSHAASHPTLAPATSHFAARRSRSVPHSNEMRLREAVAA